MKTKVKRMSKRTLAVFLGVVMLITSIGVGSLITVNALSVQGSIYADISGTTNWGTSVSYITGKSDYSTSYNMTQLTGTKLYYKNIGSDWASDATQSGFHNGAWGANNGAGQKISDRWGSTKHTSINTSYGCNSGSTYLATITGSANDYNLSFGYYSGGYSDFNKKLTIKTALKSGSTYAETNTKLGTFSASNAVKITGDSTTTAQSISQTNGTGTITTAKTNTATISQTAVSGYTFKGWKLGSLDTSGSSLTTGSYSFTGTGEEKTLYAYYEQAATNYTGITADAKGSTDGSAYSTTLTGTPATISANSYTTGSSALTITAGTVSGYTFAQWKVTEGSGTIGNATEASTTFTPTASNTTVTAQYKKNYTFSNGTTDTHGTVTVPSGTVLAGASYSGKVTPAAGYKIKTLTVGGVAVADAVGKTSAYTYNGTTGSSTTGTTTPISVVATFEPITDLKLYIAGRFRVRPSSGSSSWTTTYASGSDWNATSTNIPFTYLSGTTYKVDTYASLKELSAQPTNNQDPWFFVYDKTNSKAWHPTSSNRELGTTTEYNLTTNTDTYNVRFNSNSTDSPVTIYFDYSTKRLWYSVPDLYDVTVGTATGGTVTASPSRAEAGTTITLNISPSDGYQLSSITAKDSSNATVTLSGTGNTRTFTMPANNVTVTPVFEKITWSGLTAVGKYSTTAANDASYNNDFPAGSAPNVTIAATSATQVDGVEVTAPATDPTGYVFAGWYTAAGSFENNANKDTTFYPNAANAVAIAKYKKIFTITSSVDDTGTGAGTVSVSVTNGSVSGQANKVLAGGSYTITATAASHSAVESVKVNDTAKTATDSQTISNVSEDQEVKVKFKSNITIRGGSTIGTNWTTGDAMTSNAAGTEFTKAYTDVAAGAYEFKLHNGTSYSDDSSATVTITGGASTGTMTTKAAAGVNWKLTLKQAANVTIKSDGTKITEIKVVPANATKHKVTFKKAANTTITGQYEGVNFTTASADAVVEVYNGDEISFTATADSGKYISTLTTSAGSLTPAFAAGDTYTGKLTNVTSARTVTPTAADKFSVKAVTNKSARGTVTVNTSTAAPGESITITVSPKNGVLKSLTCTYANGAVYTCNLSTKEWTKTANATSASIKKGSAIKKTLLTGADTTYTMTIAENSAATINATFDAYSGESTWYYNGYDTSGNALSGYHTKQMTEGMVGGEKFSYYHVEGRSGTDQLMTVSDGAPSSGTRYVYFVRPNNYGNGWSASNNPKAHFWKNGGQDYDTWPGTEMSWQWNNDYGQGVYKIAIPDGADRVSFNDATNNGQHQTVDIDLTTTSGAYYVGEWNSTYSKYDYGTWDTGWADQGWVASGTEYFYQNSTHNGDYTGDFNTKGFYNHKTASKEFAKPKELGSNTGDYYINVLYPNTTYTINGITKKTGTNPMIIWSAEPLFGDDENVTIYAKDGSIRSETYGSTYANIADTKIYLNNETVGTKHSGNITNQTWETYKAAKGDTIVIKTQIGATDSSTLSNAADLKAKYYVRGFCVNGEVSELLEWNANGLYTLTYKVPEDEEISKIEITPIYYLKDTSANPIVTYRVTGFTDELKAVGSGKPNWGDTLYTYPFYGKLGSNNNALGAYPGQPMVYYKGQYQMQIPQKSTAWDIYYDDGALSGYSGNPAKANAVANTNVSGVTMSNGYYDIVHRTVMGYGNNSSSADHVQTYDYGDFFKIFNEKKPVDNIVFDFKYRTKKHNFENQPGASITKTNLDTNYGTNGNGFELLTNFHGRTVDLFGTPLSGDAADPSKTTPVYVVSIGGVNGSAGVENIAGYYATEWMVYGSSDGSSYSRISAGNKNSIPPEVLVLNDDDNTSFNTTTYPSADAKHTITDWKALYTSLEAYRGKPVMISYEAADAQIGAGNYATSGSGGATRNDGRWLYSKNGENITSNIKIQYSDDNGANYTDLNTTTPQVSGLSAYFTNDGVEEEMTYSTTIDPDKTFDFEAKTTNANYKFVGWFMEDGTKITTDNASHTERSGSYTFVAKFMQVSEGQLILSHSTDTNDTYKGSGTSEIGVVVKDGEEVIRTYDVSTTDITLDNKIIKSDSNYTIEVTLRSTPTGENTLGLVNTGSTNVDKFQPRKATSQTITFNVRDLYTNTTQNIKSLIYHSYYSKVTYEYDVTFKFQGRLYDSNKKRVDNTFRKKGSLTDKQIANYVTGDTLAHTRYISSDFLTSIAPYEENYGENLTWDFKSVTDVRRKFTYIPETNSYKLTVGITGASSEQENPYEAIQSEKSKELKVTFDLPFAYDSKGRATNIERMTKSTQDNFVVTVNYGQVAKIDPTLGHPTPGATQYDDTYVTAPKVLVDNNKDTYFQYWEVKDKNNKVVTKCYMTRFNFVAYDNYTVAPVYGSEKYVADNDNTIQTSIQFLDTTRNQWNNGGYGNAKDITNSDAQTASDLLFNDFLISFSYKGKEINSSNLTGVNTGFVVQRVAKLKTYSDDSVNTNISDYEESYLTSEESDGNTIKTYIANGANKAYAGGLALSNIPISASELDNKDRVQWYYSVYNSRGWTDDAPKTNYQYKDYVYRAYSYINDNGTVTLSEKPVYFIMYDKAVATNATNG